MELDRIPDDVGVILVDHGSKYAAANELLEEVAARYAEATGAAIVEPAHMELAEPTLFQAFERCVTRGAASVVVHPYFLAPGRHSTTDIPRMAREAAAHFPGTPCTVTAPLGLDPGMLGVIHRRVLESLSQAPA